MPRKVSPKTLSRAIGDFSRRGLELRVHAAQLLVEPSLARIGEVEVDVVDVRVGDR